MNTKTVKASSHRITVLGLVALGILFLNGQRATATDVSGTISTNTTWTAAGSPYNMTADVTVPAGVTLTIQPGVQVIADHYEGIAVDGTLVAVGTGTNRIVMNGSTASPGWWLGIHVRNAGSATLSYVDILNAGYYNNAAVYKTGSGDLSLRNCLLKNGSKAGLRLASGSASFISENNAFEDNADGVTLEIGTSFTDTTSTFSGNSYAPVAIWGGTMTTAVVWELSSAYAMVVVNDLTVSATGSLTVKPGTVVKFDQFEGLHVDGQLTAEGTVAKPIHFTDYRDDSVGGDSNNDGSATAASPGWWLGLRVRNAGSATLSYVDILNAGYYHGAAVYKSGSGDLSLRNCLLKNGSKAGLRLASGSASFISENNAFEDNADGVTLEIGTSFTDTTSTFSGNSYAPVAIWGGTIATPVTWELSSAYAMVVVNDLTVSATGSLTVMPGTVVKFDQYEGIAIDGQFTAEGTVAKPIYFTDYRDDSVGGDSNNNGSTTAAAPGWWAGLTVRNAGSASFDRSTISYGGYYNYANIYKTGAGELSLLNSTLTNCSAAGLKLGPGSASFISENNAFENNADGVGLVVGTSFSDTTSTFSGNSYAPVAIWGGTQTAAVTWELSPAYAMVVVDDLTVKGTVYDDDGVMITPAASLTVEPGTVVKFDRYEGIWVSGQFTAEGTVAEPIHFTDYRDDSVGGDSNDNETATAATPGWWAGLTVQGEGSASFENCSVSYGGYYNYANIYKVGTGNLSIRGSVLSHGSAAGLKLTSGSESFTSENNAYSDNADGVRLGINTSFSDTSSGFSGNSYAPVAVNGGTMGTEVTWELSSAYAMVLVDDLTISTAGSLIIQPGTVVKSDQYEGIWVSGQFSAIGTAGSPILFTDYRDDSVGGDTGNNGDATSPAPSWWAGIKVNAGGQAFMGNCTMDYTGYYNYASVRVVDSGDLSLVDCTLRAGGDSGLTLYRSSGDISVTRCLFETNKYGVNVYEVTQSIVLDLCLFEGNTSFGVINTRSTEVDAANNWWGDASGPYHETLNAEGTGDPVSDDVLFEPWRRSAGIAGILAPRRSGTIVAGDALRFFGSPTGNAFDGYAWDFGDGRTASVQNPGLVVFPDAGSREVSYAIVVDGEADPFPEGRSYTVISDSGSHPDLRLDRIEVPSSGGPGDAISVDYTVTNVGPGDLVASTWTDAVYLSEDEILDVTDRPMGTATLNRGLAAGESYSGQLDLTLPAIVDGVRHLIVSVNDEWQMLELHRMNNEGSDSISVSIPGLTMGEVFAGTHSAGISEQYFRIDASGGKNLVITFDNGLEGLSLAVKFGSLPTRSLHDYLLADGTLVIPAATAGSWYILVHGDGLVRAADFTLSYNESDVALTAVTPNMQDAAAELELSLTGAGFADPVQVELVSPGGTTFAPDSVVIESFTQLTAVYTAGRLPAGQYDVRVTRTGSTATLDDAIEMISGGAPDFYVNVVSPSAMGYHNLATLYVEYGNKGNAPMPAPLLLITALQDGSPGALMTLDQANVSRGFWTSAIPKGFATSIRLLAGGEQPGTLMPGETARIPVYYAGWLKPWDFSYPPFNFKAVALTADDDQVVPWAAQKATLMAEGTDPDAWTAIWQNFTASVGTTVGDFVSALSRDAIYLSKIGLDVKDVNALLAFEVIKARGLIGPLSELTGEVDLDVHQDLITLQFNRSFPRNITQRYRLGPMGYGWNHGWELRVDEETDGTIAMTRGNGATRVYQPDSRGGAYFSGNGDSSRLTKSGDITTVTLENGTFLRFDASGRLVRNEDRHGNAIVPHYANGLLARLEHSNGLQIVFSYNSSNLISRVEDSMGNRTDYTYDTGKHLVSVVDSRRGQTAYTYSGSSDLRKRHALTRVTQTGDVQQAFGYDSRGRLSSISHGLGSTSFAYSQGDMSVTDGEGYKTTTSFNHLGAMVRLVDSESGVTTIVTDDDGRTTTIRSADGTTMQTVRNQRGHVVEQVNQNGERWTFKNDRSGRIAKSVSPEGRVRSMSYDTAGNLTRVVDPSGHQTRFEYDGMGRLTKRTTPSGVTQTTTFDSVGRITKKAYSGGTERVFEYDSKHRLIKATNSEGDSVFTYDSVGNLTKVVYPNGLFIEYEYDAAGRVTAAIDQNGRASRYAYNGAGLLDRLENTKGEVLMTYVYDGAGRLEEKLFTNGTRTAYIRNGRGQITRQTTYASNDSVLADFSVDYDVNGKLSSYTTPEGVTTYAYDAVGRLTQMVNTPEVGAVENRTYERSPDGALEKLVINGVATAFTVDSGGRITAVGGSPVDYDADGNISSKGSGAEQIDYTRDVTGQVTEAESSAGTYRTRYDALGTPLGVDGPSMSVNYLYDGIGKGMLFGEYDGSGDPIRTYQNGLGMAVVNHGGSSWFPEYDPVNGDTILVTSNSLDATSAGEPPMAMDQPLEQVKYLPPYDYPDPWMPAPGSYGWMLKGIYDFASPHVKEAARSATGFGVNNSQVDQVLSRMSDSKTPEGNALWWSSTNASIAGLFGAFVQSADGIARWTNTVVTITDVPPRVLEGINFLKSPSLGNALSGFGLVFNGLEVMTGISETWRDNRSVDWADVANPFGSLDDGTSKIRHGLASAALGIIGLTASTAIAPVVAIAGIAAFISDNTGGLQEDFWIWWDDLDVTGESLQGSAWAGSRDPNQKLGPAGYGDAHHVAPGALLTYRVDFENHKDATAPAQVVTIRDQLPDEVDASTFELLDVGFGDISVPVDPGTKFFETVVDYAYQDEEYDFEIEVHVKVEIEAGEIRATFYSIDPETDLPPPVDVGFLPPEPEKEEGEVVPGQGRGQGHISYAVRPKAGLADGTEIRNIATIQFDFSFDIDTNQVDPLDPSKGTDPDKEALVTIDSKAPTATVSTLPAQSGNAFTVSWTGDDAGGSGVVAYDIYVSIDGGPWTPWLEGTTEASAEYTAEAGRSYAFYAHATDGVGAAAALIPEAQAQTISGVSYLINISNRGKVGTAANIMIPGFVISGTGTKKVLVRAVGPTLGAFGVPGTLDNPQMMVFKGAEVVDVNDDWGQVSDQAGLEAARAQVGAFPLESGTADSALLLDLDPGGYTVQVSGVADSTGVALVELYDADESGDSTAKLVNISNRGEVGTGASIMIPGFVVGGQAAKTVLIRGVGPTLGAFGVPGVLENPMLAVFASGTDTPFITNDDWEQAADQAAMEAARAKVGAFPLEAGSADAAVLVTLDPGVYTVQVWGVADTEGVALVEIYEVEE